MASRKGKKPYSPMKKPIRRKGGKHYAERYQST